MEILTEMYKRVAKAYNNLDYFEIEAIAADNIRYTSQNVLRDLKGKESVMDYLKMKFKAIAEGNSPVYAELAFMKSQKEWTIQLEGLEEGEPCILLSQGAKENKGAIILISIGTRLIFLNRLKVEFFKFNLTKKSNEEEQIY
jgi:hypothetical protein